MIHELCSEDPKGNETADYYRMTPLADTLLSKKGQVITELDVGGWVGTKKNQVAVHGGGVLSVSPETQQDAIVSKAFPLPMFFSVRYMVRPSPFWTRPSPLP